MSKNINSIIYCFQNIIGRQIINHFLNGRPSITQYKSQNKSRSDGHDRDKTFSRKESENLRELHILIAIVNLSCQESNDDTAKHTRINC